MEQLVSIQISKSSICLARLWRHKRLWNWECHNPFLAVTNGVVAGSGPVLRAESPSVQLCAMQWAQLLLQGSPWDRRIWAAGITRAAGITAEITAGTTGIAAGTVALAELWEQLREASAAGSKCPLCPHLLGSHGGGSGVSSPCCTAQPHGTRMCCWFGPMARG